MTRQLACFADVPADRQLTDEAMHTRFPERKAWDPARRTLPADEARCQAPAQGDTGANAAIVAEGFYYRCTLRHHGRGQFCTRHREKTNDG